MMPPVVDDLGRAVRLKRPPTRIVSLVPSLTELVCALGGAGRLAGVTRYCTEPAGVVARLPKLGGTKNPRLDAIAALRPDLVLVNGEENRREDFAELLDADLAVYVSFPTTVAGAAAGIERLGHALGAGSAAAALAASIRTGLAALSAMPLAPVPVFCPIWRTPWMSFNADTFAHDLLQAAGARNVCAEAGRRYPVVELAEVALRRPRLVLLPDEPYAFAARHRALLGELRDTPAAQCGSVYLVDGKALSWYGPRTPAALRYFRHLVARADRVACGPAGRTSCGGAARD